MPQRLEPSPPRRSRLATVWALFAALVIGFVGASALIPTGRETRPGTVVAGSFVDAEGRWHVADTRLPEYRGALARLPVPPAPEPLVSVAGLEPLPEESPENVELPPAPVPETTLAALPPDVRDVEPAAGAGDARADDATASLVRLAETLERPAVPIERANGTAATEPAGTRNPPMPAPPRDAEPRLAMAAQPAAPLPRRPTLPTEGSARIIELPQLPEPRHVAVARAVPPPDGFGMPVAATGAVARPAAAGGAAWTRFARPFEASDLRPRIALVVTDLGLSQGVTDQAIHYLPGAITLAFSPFADNLPAWVEQARRAGHEVLINLPPEAAGGAADAPGPALQPVAAQPGAEAAGRLEWVLGRTSGYVGVASFLGAGASGQDQVLRPILTALRDRGFIFVGRQPGARTPGARLAQELGVPYTAIDRQIDADPSREAIEQRLAELERAARETGTVVALLRPHEASFERLAIWHTSLDAKGIALAPITAVLNRQRNR